MGTTAVGTVGHRPGRVGAVTDTALDGREVVVVVVGNSTAADGVFVVDDGATCAARVVGSRDVVVERTGR
jgi:hypothetical protein